LGAEPEPFDPKTMKVREVEDAGYRLSDHVGDPLPLAIRSKAELEKDIPTKPAQDALAKGVDFKKEYLVLIVWTGSGGDAREYKVGRGKRGHEASFRRPLGASDDRARHQKVYVLPRSLPFRLEK